MNQSLVNQTYVKQVWFGIHEKYVNLVHLSLIDMKSVRIELCLTLIKISILVCLNHLLINRNILNK